MDFNSKFSSTSFFTSITTSVINLRDLRRKIYDKGPVITVDLFMKTGEEVEETQSIELRQHRVEL